MMVAPRRDAGSAGYGRACAQVKVCVIGGGVAGMATAYRLMQRGHTVALYEASPDLGGLVRTFEVGGTRLEAFYHHLFSTDTTILSLIDELGFGDRMRWI